VIRGFGDWWIGGLGDWWIGGLVIGGLVIGGLVIGGLVIGDWSTGRIRECSKICVNCWLHPPTPKGEQIRKVDYCLLFIEYALDGINSPLGVGGVTSS